MYHAIFLTDHDRYFRIPPLGTYLLSDVLRTAGYKVLIIDMYSSMQDKLKEILKNAISEETLFVGYGSTFFASNWDFNKHSYTWLPTSEDFFSEINHYVKELNPKCKILFGGSNSKKLLEFAKENNTNYGVDYTVHGYSENMLLDLVKSLKLNKTPKFSRKTLGIYEIDYDLKGTSIDFKNSKMNWYPEDGIIQNESLPLEVARGCIFKCKFCSYPLLGKDPKDLSYIKIEDNIYREFVENYEKFKTTSYFVVDDTFNENDEKIRILLRARDRAKIDLNFVGYLRLDLIHRRPQQLDLLHELNFNGFFFGIESMHYPAAKWIGKGIKPEHIKETLFKIKDKFNNRVSMAGGFIIGLPHETEESVNEWAEWVLSNDSPLTWVNFNPLFITQNGSTTHTDSEFFKNYHQYGYEIQNKHVWKNQHWDFHKCSKLAFQYNSRALISGRNKISPFIAIGLKKYNLDYYDLIQTPEKTLYEENYTYNKTNGYKHLLNSKFQNMWQMYKDSYIGHVLERSKK